MGVFNKCLGEAAKAVIKDHLAKRRFRAAFHQLGTHFHIGLGGSDIIMFNELWNKFDLQLGTDRRTFFLIFLRFKFWKMRWTRSLEQFHHLKWFFLGV